jgi:hypothetical protein
LNKDTLPANNSITAKHDQTANAGLDSGGGNGVKDSKGVAISLAARRNSTSPKKKAVSKVPMPSELSADRTLGKVKIAVKVLGLASRTDGETRVLADRAGPTQIKDPWNVKDRGEKTPIQKLEKLAAGMSEKASDKPRKLSPLDSFIRGKSSSAVSTQKSRSDGADRAKIVTTKSATLKLDKTQSERQQGYAASVGIPFLSPAKENKKSNYTKTVSPVGLDNVSPAQRATVSPAQRAVVSQHAAIKRKQAMDQPDTLLAIFSGVDQTPEPNSRPSFYSPAKELPTERGSAPAAEKIVAPPGKRYGQAAVTDKIDVRNDGQSQRVQKVIALAEATAKRKQMMRKSGSFDPVFSDTDAAPSNPSKTLFSITNEAARIAGWQSDSVTYEDPVEQDSPNFTPAKLLQESTVTNNQQASDVPAVSANMTESIAEDSESTLQDLAAKPGQDVGGVAVKSQKIDEVQVDMTLNTLAAGNQDGDDKYWVVPVESLGSGVAHMLGDAVGGVVYIGQALAGNKKRKLIHKPPAVPQAIVNDGGAALKRGQRVKAIMANKVGGGVWGVFSGVGQVAKGGASIVVGSLGYLGGALVYLSGAKK